MIDEGQRAKMRQVFLCGDRAIMRLESIGVRRLSDLRDRDPWEVMYELNLEAGRDIWRPPLAVLALQNLIDAARRDAESPAERREGI